MILVLVFLFSFGIVFAQNAKHIPSAEAKELYSKALKYFYKKDYEEALNLAQKAKDNDPLYEDAYKLRSTIYSIREKFELEKEEYLQLLSHDSVSNLALLNLGTLLYNHNYFSESKQYYVRYLKLKDIRPDLQKLISGRIIKIDAILQFQAHPVAFHPINAGTGINTSLNEYFPTLTVDGETMYFTRRKPLNANYQNEQHPERQRQAFNEDIMVSHKVDTVWQTATDAPGINTLQNEGAMCISPDGSIMLFTSCNHVEPGERGDIEADNCDIYISFFKDGKWSKPRNIGAPINTRFYETQPSISFDNKTIYFVSKRPGGLGGCDIYKCAMDENGQLGDVINLGPKINTAEDEQAPFIHPDNSTLYFGSRVHIGLGMNDIFIARKNAQDEFDSAINVGYPINTTGDEPGMIVDGRGDLAYYSSSGKGSLGGLDIFYFKIPETIKPNPVSYLKGKVFDAESKKSLAASFELVDLSTDKVVIKRNLDNNGEFLIPIPSGKDYLVNVSAPGYLFYSDHIPLKDYKNPSPFLKDIPLPLIKVGQKIALRNVFFASDKYELLKSSFNELNRLIALLKANPSINIEISGHTDNSGNANHNKELSVMRAQSVYNYLIKIGGISPKRLVAIGYGDTKPASNNNTPEGMALNRRTEILIIN